MKKLLIIPILFLPGSSALVSAQNFEEISASLRKGNNKGIPTVKGFSDEFIHSLDKRGQKKIYTKENSANFEYIGMPIGGIATGQLYMGGDGQLWFWDIFNHSNAMGQYVGEEAYRYPYKRSNKYAPGVNDIFQGFAVRIGDEQWNLNRDGFDQIAFRGEYPIAKVDFRDSSCPIDISLEAFSPFIPLELENSTYPATIMIYTFKNPTDQSIELDVTGWLENPSLYRSRYLMSDVELVNQVVEFEGAKGVQFSANNDLVDIRNIYDSGDMTLVMMGEDVNTNVNYNSSNYQRAPDPFEKSDLKSASRGKGSVKSMQINATVSKSLTLEAGEEENVTYVLSWYFPNSGVWQGGRREYVNRFDSSTDVSKTIIEEYDYLTKTTEEWNDTWYDSSLPYWFLDRTFVNASILATQTCFLFEDGRFYGFEGGLQGTGTCTHVWGYEHAMARLFPMLERNLREKTDFVDSNQGGAFDTNSGKVGYRGKYDSYPAVDGQASIVVRSYLIHKMMSDNDFLKSNYANIKLAMEYLINTNDDNHDGILTGWQHNTLDSDWNGEVAWLSGYYQTALLASAQMASEYGDKEFAKLCTTIAKKGRKLMERDLFNGDYFFQLPEGDGKKTVGIQNGCEYSQLLGQSQAYQIGLGEVLDPEKVTKAIDALWRYNFTTDVAPYRERYPAGRWYAMPGEGGLIACTWPNGGQEALENDNPRFAAYNHECQNGYEYAATSLMMWHNEPYRALAHTRIMEDNRYDGAKRNPYCEVEWGLHYARSMASYGLFTAVCGFDYHGPSGRLKFAPKIQQEDFKAPVVTAEGWGTYSQKALGKGAEYSLNLRHGKLRLSELELPLIGKKGKIECSVDGVPTKVKVKFNHDMMTLKFDKDIVLNQGSNIVVSL